MSTNEIQPLNLTGKQEGFAQSVVGGTLKLNQSDAYRANYDCSKMSKAAIYVEASRLMANPKISLRIQQLQQAAQEQFAWTRTEFLQECVTNVTEARKANQYAASNGALAMIGKATGHLTDKPTTIDVPITRVVIVLQGDGEEKEEVIDAGLLPDAEPSPS